MGQSQYRDPGPGADPTVGTTRVTTPPPSPPPDADHGRYNLAGAPEGLGTLIGGVIKDLQDLLRGEIQLAKTELKESAAGAGKGIGFLVGAGLLGILGLTFLLLALVEVLDNFLPRWAAAGLVGLGLVLLAGVLALLGKRLLSPENLKPEQTIDSLKEDKEWAQQQISSVKR
jgi:hypothetical protein